MPLCLKSVRIWTFSGPHFPGFGLKFGFELRIQTLFSHRQTKQGLDLFFVLDDSLDRETQFVDRSVVEQDLTNDSIDVIANISVEILFRDGFKDLRGWKNKFLIDLVTKSMFMMLIIWKSWKHKLLSYNKKINLLNTNYKKSNLVIEKLSDIKETVLEKIITMPKTINPI